MDPLSSLKLMTGPDLGSRLTGPMADSIAKIIPSQDMEKLNTGNTLGASQSVSAMQTGGSFQNLLGNFVNEVNTQQAAAGDAVNGLLSGKNVSLHQAMISMEEANVSFQMMVEVRNKLLDSYQEMMRMQI